MKNQPSTVRRDLRVAIAIAVTVYLGAIATDFSEWWWEVTRSYEALEVDELLPLFTGALIGLAWFSFRLWRLERNELQRRVRAEEDLWHAQKMEHLGLLSAGIAHEFNNLLTAFYGLLALAEKDSETTEQRQHLQEMEALIRRGTDLTSSLLGFARRRVRQVRATDVNAVIERMYNWLRLVVSKKIVIRSRLEPALWECLVDSGQLEQALVNLALNARDAMPDGGSLTFITENLRLEQPRSEVSAGDYLRIAVIDTGIGMAPAVMARVFDSFFTTKADGRGTGLGLNIVRGFVDESKGHIELESTPGKGTTFAVLLPRLELAAESEAEPGRESEDETSSGPELWEQ